MYKGNISDLSQEEINKIDLQRIASLLIFKLKTGKITRFDITQEIEKLPVDQQDTFKGFLNHYKGTKNNES